MRAPARRVVLGRLSAAPARLAAEAARVTSAEASSGTPPGAWTAAQVLAHLAAVEVQVWQARLDMLEADTEPDWLWTEPGPLDDPRAASPDGAAALFAEARTRMLARLAAFDDAMWRRTGVHAVYGRLDVAALLGVAAAHDDDHLDGLRARGR